MGYEVGGCGSTYVDIICISNYFTVYERKNVMDVIT